jgi:hypothetical protein
VTLKINKLVVTCQLTFITLSVSNLMFKLTFNKEFICFIYLVVEKNIVCNFVLEHSSYLNTELQLVPQVPFINLVA